MAGRFEKLTLSHWGAGDLAIIAGITPKDAAYRVVTHGGYPGTVVFWNDPARWQAYVRDAIIEPAIGRDILHLEKVRKPALLRQVFAVAAAHLEAADGASTDMDVDGEIAAAVDIDGL